MGVDGWDAWVVGWVDGWVDELEPPATPHPLNPLASHHLTPELRTRTRT